MGKNRSGLRMGVGRDKAWVRNGSGKEYQCSAVWCSVGAGQGLDWEWARETGQGLEMGVGRGGDWDWGGTGQKLRMGVGWTGQGR